MTALTSRSIRARLYRGVGGLLLLVATSSALGLVLLHRLGDSESTLATKAQPYLADLSSAAVAAKAAANDERGYLMTGDPKFLEEIRVKRDPVVYDALAQAAAIYPAGSDEAKAITAIRAGFKKWATARDAELEQYKSDRSGAIDLALGSNRDLRKAYEGLIDDAVGAATAGVKSSDSHYARTNDQATWLLLGFLGFALLVGIAFALRVATSLTHRLAKLTVVADQLSIGQIDGLDASIGGDDELGKLGESMQGVVAAFQELYTSSSAKAA